MAKKIVYFMLSLLVNVALASYAWAGFIYQNFEPENANSLLAGPVGGRAVVSVTGRSEKVHLGRNALKIQAVDYWSGAWVQTAETALGIDLQKANNDRFMFWIYALPQRECYPLTGCSAGTNNTVGLVFYDAGSYKASGFEVWTTQAATYDSWTKLKILFSQLPPDFDLRHVTRVEFKNYLPGVYYLDDLHAVREDRVYQSFEKEQRSGSIDSDYGWKWNDKDTAELSSGDEPVAEGSYSWKLVSTGNWGGTGIQSQERKYYHNGTGVEQTFWRVDLSPEFNDRLTFKVFASAANGMGNNLAVQFYDNANHATDATKVVVWTKAPANNGQWTRLAVLFSDIRKVAPDFDLKNINKIQFQYYWPGTFYVDDIRATSAVPVIKEHGLGVGAVRWESIPGAANYRLQESTAGASGPWVTIYSGAKTSYQSSRLSRVWLRLRWEEGFSDARTIPYASDWSDAVEVRPVSVFFKQKYLRQGLLTWDARSQSMSYEVQSAASAYGPWASFYCGAVPTGSLHAVSGRWYRIRGVKKVSGKVVDLTPWCRPQLYMFNPASAFVRATGTVLRERKGQGDVLTLKGVNLGNYLVIEPWMMGLSVDDPADTNPDPAKRQPLDDWKIRKVLHDRFGAVKAARLLEIYENAYLNEFDFDYLLDQGVTMVRLPFYYRNLQSDDGQWIRNAQGQIDFTPLDRVVEAMSDRGIYVVIDLHGAPGGQSVEVPTGRAGVNKLFDPVEGPAYQQRTQELWVNVARHYKDNQWVLGYDLLNEPIGIVPSTPPPADLVAFYDRLYKAVRRVDPDHLIIMEGVWYPDPSDPQKKKYVEDWQTLPKPSQKGWSNVMYQFHFYKWGADSDFAAHKQYIDAKLAQARIQQPLYNVPLLIGEFTGFEQRQVWEYYLSAFNERQWSWSLWSYKYFNAPSNWGVVNHTRYDEDAPPRFFSVYRDGTTGDSYEVLARKLAKYATAGQHSVNQSLQEVFSAGIHAGEFACAPAPYIARITALFAGYAESFTIVGKGFGTSRGSVKFGNVALPVKSWSESSITVYLHEKSFSGAAPVVVTASNGKTSNAVDVIAVKSAAEGVMSGLAGGGFQFRGTNLGDTPGKVVFYSAPNSANRGDAGISFWSDSLIRGFIPPDAVDVGSRYTIVSRYGGELYPSMIATNHPPVFAAVSVAPLTVGVARVIALSAVDPDSDVLTYSVEGLPSGAVFGGKTFMWTPRANQQGQCRIVFKVTDGQAMVEMPVVLTVNSRRQR